MDKEKPPVLSDEEIDEAWPDKPSANVVFPQTTEELPQFIAEIRRCLRFIAQAQRDADVEWYEEHNKPIDGYRSVLVGKEVKP